jgi:hypothetical protein
MRCITCYPGGLVFPFRYVPEKPQVRRNIKHRSWIFIFFLFQKLKQTEMAEYLASIYGTEKDK